MNMPTGDGGSGTAASVLTTGGAATCAAAGVRLPRALLSAAHATAAHARLCLSGEHGEDWCLPMGEAVRRKAGEQRGRYALTPPPIRWAAGIMTKLICASGDDEPHGVPTALIGQKDPASYA